MGARRRRHRRKRKGLVPPIVPQAFELASELVSRRQLYDKQVARVLQKRGFDFSPHKIQQIRTEMGIPAVRRAKPKEAPDPKVERAERLIGLRRFKNFPLDEKLQRIERAHKAVLQLEETLSVTRSEGARKRLRLALRNARSLIRVFSNTLPIEAKRELKRRGLIK